MKTYFVAQLFIWADYSLSKSFFLYIYSKNYGKKKSLMNGQSYFCITDQFSTHGHTWQLKTAGGVALQSSQGFGQLSQNPACLGQTWGDPSVLPVSNSRESIKEGTERLTLGWEWLWTRALRMPRPTTGNTKSGFSWSKHKFYISLLSTQNVHRVV